MNIEEFVNSYLQEHRHDVLLNPYNGLIDFANTFKEQMLKDAVEAYIVKSYNPCTENSERSLHGIELLYEDKNKPYLLAGDKVRIVVLKEEE